MEAEPLAFLSRPVMATDRWYQTAPKARLRNPGHGMVLRAPKVRAAAEGADGTTWSSREVSPGPARARVGGPGSAWQETSGSAGRSGMMQFFGQRVARHGLRFAMALCAFVAVGSPSRAQPPTAPMVEGVRYGGPGGGHSFGGGFGGHGFHGGGFGGRGFRGGGFRGGYGGRRFFHRGYGYGPGFGIYGFRRRQAWCFYHPGACY